MKILSPIKLPTEVFELFTDNNVIVSYYGSLDLELTNQLLGKIRAYSASLKTALRSKLYACLAELIENAYKHQSSAAPLQRNSIVVISLHRDIFQISVGNIISVKDKQVVSQALSTIESMTSEDIDNEIIKRLKSADPEKTPSAKIGLLKIAKKSKNRIHHSIHELDNGSEFILLRTFID